MRRIFCWLVFIGVLATVAPAAQLHAEEAWDVTQETLKNGLTVLILRDPRAPVVTVQVWYKVGSRNEQLGVTGISHLLEHLMFRGTPKYGPGEFSRIVQERGGSHNAFTSDDNTVYFENAAAQHLDILLELEADRMANLTLSEDIVAAEKQIVKEERRLRTHDEPASDLWEQVSAAAYTAHPYGWPIIGWMNDVENTTLADIEAFRQVFYAPDNVILVIAGDINAATILPKVKATFGMIAKGQSVPTVTAKEPPQRGERRVMLKRPAALPVYIAAYHAPNYASEDAFPLSLLSVILGGGRSSRLQLTLVEKKALTLSADANYDRTSLDPSLFTLSMRVAPNKTWQEAEAALFQEIDKLKASLVNAKELERAKNLVESAFVYGQDSLFYRALQLGQYALLGDWSLIRKVVPGIRAVTAADLQRVARTYLREDNRTVGIMLPDNTEKTDRHQKQASPSMKTTGKKSKKKAESQQAQ